jgi:hypothetical protein
MNHKSHQYLQGCIQSAERSIMSFRLGAVLVKGGKILSSGYNHQRPRYEGPGPGRRHCSAVVRVHASLGLHAPLSDLRASPFVVHARRAARDLRSHGRLAVREGTGCVDGWAEATCSTRRASRRHGETERRRPRSAIIRTNVISSTKIIGCRRHIRTSILDRRRRRRLHMYTYMRIPRPWELVDVLRPRLRSVMALVPIERERGRRLPMQPPTFFLRRLFGSTTLWLVRDPHVISVFGKPPREPSVLDLGRLELAVPTSTSLVLAGAASSV